MKNFWARWFALGLMLATLVVLTQGPAQVAEAKKIKIKKVLKELKKLKKYGYLLAYQRKKLYAIPFPMPLPIFVKRQHIYTTIPIIPRYIQHPQHSSSQHGSSSYSSMASSSSETSSSTSPPPSYESMSMYMPEPTSSYQSSPKSNSYANLLGGASSYGLPMRTKSKKHSLLDQSSYMNAIPTSSKYLSQLAGVLGQGTLGGSTTGKDLLTKIMNGQAKILPPTSLLSAIKGPSSALLNLYQQQTGTSSSSSSSSSPSSSSSSTSSSSHDDQDTKTSDHSSASSSDETSGSSAVTKSQDSSSSSLSSSEANKPSASEIHKSRFKPYMIRTPYGRIPPAAANMIASMNPAAVMGSGMMPPPHPFAMMAAQSPALMQRIPMLQPASAQLMPAAMVYPQAAVYPMAGQLEASPSDQMESQSSEINESYASANENQQREDELTRYRAALGMQHRRQVLLRLALMRERERELVESRGQQQQSPVSQQLQAAQVLAYYKQQQQLHQLKQLHQLQQLHHRHRQHQQQLQQNTIDR